MAPAPGSVNETPPTTPMTRAGAPAGQRHLGDGYEEPAIRQIVAGRDMPGVDLAADKVAVAPLRCEIDRRRRAGLAVLDLPQIERASQMAARLADEYQCVALSLQREIDRASGVGD